MAANVTGFATQIVAEDRDLAVGGSKQRGEDLEERRLAAAVGSE
jgi:hypothetical protein